MNTITVILLLVAVVSAKKLHPGDNPLDSENTGPTPGPVDCPKSLCHGRADGNYEYNYHGKKEPNYFVQCSYGLPSCQACWPIELVFSGKCNQCMYKYEDKCFTTQTPAAAPPSFSCPDVCPGKGPTYSGNIYDHSEKRHYVACWKGITVGCVNCPAGLLFNEEMNACLFDGIHFTKPL